MYFKQGLWNEFKLLSFFGSNFGCRSAVLEAKLLYNSKCPSTCLSDMIWGKHDLLGSYSRYTAVNIPIIKELNYLLIKYDSQTAFWQIFFYIFWHIFGVFGPIFKIFVDNDIRFNLIQVYSDSAYWFCAQTARKLANLFEVFFIAKLLCNTLCMSFR